MADSSFRRELILVFLTAAITILTTCIGWAFVDRLQLERKEQIIDTSTGRLDKIEEQIRTLPSKVASEDEIILLEKQQARDHFDIMQEFGQIENRMDQFAWAARGARTRYGEHTEPPGSTIIQPPATPQP